MYQIGIINGVACVVDSADTATPVTDLKGTDLGQDAQDIVAFNAAILRAMRASQSTGAALNAADYGLSTSGSGAANATALSNAVTAALAGANRLYIPNGTYNITAVVFPAPLEVFGAGQLTTILQPSTATNSDFITVTNDSDVVTDTVSTWRGAYIHDLSIVRPTAFADPTNGAGLHLTASGNLHIGTRIERCLIQGFYDNLRMTTCGMCLIRDNFLINHRRSGVYLENLYNNDQGDNILESNWFWVEYGGGPSGYAADQAAIHHHSGSGNVIRNNKSWFSQYGIYHYLDSTNSNASAFATADKITGNYMDGHLVAAIHLNSSWGRSGSGAGINTRNQTNTMLIANNHFFASYAVEIAALSGAYSNVNLVGNFGRGTRLLTMPANGSVDILTIDGNSFDSGGASKAIIVTTPTAVTNAVVGTNNFANYSSKPDLRPDSSIWSALVAHWKLEEATGSSARVDSTNHGNDLTASASITAGSAIAGNGVHFSGSNHLSHADSSELRLGGGDFSVAFWFKPTATGFQVIASKWNATGGNCEWFVYFDNSDSKVSFAVSDSGANTVSVTASTFGNLSVDTWYFVVCSHFNGSHIRISVNGVADSAVHQVGVHSGTSLLYLGRESGGSNFSGWLDEMSLIKGRVLTVEEETWLRNDGFGRIFDSGGKWDR